MANRIYYLEQCVEGLYGEYLTECVVLAPSQQAAVQAVMRLSHDEDGWGLEIHKGRLTVVDMGPAPVVFPCKPRMQYGDCSLISIGTGEDYDRVGLTSLPAEDSQDDGFFTE